mgnify:CR=1 FL=1
MPDNQKKLRVQFAINPDTQKVETTEYMFNSGPQQLHAELPMVQTAIDRLAPHVSAANKQAFAKQAARHHKILSKQAKLLYPSTMDNYTIKRKNHLNKANQFIDLHTKLVIAYCYKHLKTIISLNSLGQNIEKAFINYYNKKGNIFSKKQFSLLTQQALKIYPIDDDQHKQLRHDHLVKTQKMIANTCLDLLDDLASTSEKNQLLSSDLLSIINKAYRIAIKTHAKTYLQPNPSITILPPIRPSRTSKQQSKKTLNNLLKENTLPTIANHNRSQAQKSKGIKTTSFISLPSINGRSVTLKAAPKGYDPLCGTRSPSPIP